MSTLTTLEKANLWAKNPYFSPESRAEIQSLIDSNNTKQIDECFYKDLEFGTGGMRSILGQGINRINIYTIRKATQALCTEVLAQKTTDPSMCISYDSRIMSFELAKVAAEVMAANGIKAYIYKRLNPVALLSFAIRHHKSMAGVMVTASHNPPEYNGFKVFWSDGAQVTPPNDQNIINNYYAITDFSTIKMTSFEEGVKQNMIAWIDESVEDAYYKAILSKSINPQMCKDNGSNLKIVYTPIHGAGLIPCSRALKDLGFTDVEVVKEQAQPDGRFPTVKSPNPENPSALKLAVDLMEKTNADIVMGSDPDTDRLGVAIKVDGVVHYLTGNQIGILKLHYMLSEMKASGRLVGENYVVKSVVTTPLLDTIAHHYGVEVFNTLTGFKWICGKMNELEKSSPNKKFIFATEESFGYLCHNYARDKDGVSSVSQMAEVTLFYKLKGMNLLDALDKIYEEFGFSREDLLSLDYFGIEGQEKISRIMAYFRNFSDNTILGNRLERIKDYAPGIEGLPQSNVLGFFFNDGNQVYLRPSGTEPKIKFYIMIQEKEGDLKTKKMNAEKKAQAFLNYFKEASERA
ncbi:MAG: phospho-sugar mutase [Bdellovibrionales bacterium]|nr:phospho-sugar mutase [Bdellovibrionales bacterium]